MTLIPNASAVLKHAWSIRLILLAAVLSAAEVGLALFGPYQDIVNVWTICDGETKGVHAGQTATPAQCDQMLAKNLVVYEAGLDRCLTAVVPGKTKVAFLSWTYNVGVGAACSSTLVRKANAGDLRGACDQLLVWNRAGGRAVPGLMNRRQAERELCLQGLKEGM